MKLEAGAPGGSMARLSLYAIAFTCAAILFVVANGIPDGPIFWNLLSADLPAGWLMLVALLFAHWYGEQRPGGTEWVERMLLTLERQRHAAAFVLWLVLCAGSLWIYRNHPLSMDEYTAVFQAKIFAAGHLQGALPTELLDYLIPPRFQNQFLMVNHETGAVLSAYWPGFSLLLAPFVWLGIPWACNPTIVAGSFLLIGRITRDLTASPLAAAWAMLFALASPAFTASGITYYSMPAHLLFNLAFVWLLLAPSPLRLFLAGLAGGFALVLHNPFPHAVFALPWLLWLTTQRGQRVRNLFFITLGYLPVVLLLGVGWLLWRQGAVSEGAAVANAATGASASLLERMMGFARSFAGLLHWPSLPILQARVGGLTKLWLWAAPLLLLLAWWGWRREKTQQARLLGASALVTFLAYFLIEFDQGHGWGYRYFHPAWGVLPVLAAIGMLKLSEEGARAFRQVALLALVSLVAANAQRFVQMGGFMQAHLAQFPPRVQAERSIVLFPARGYYALDLVQNDPWLRDGRIVLLARTRADVEAIRAHFPGAREVAENRYGMTLVEEEVKR